VTVTDDGLRCSFNSSGMPWDDVVYVWLDRVQACSMSCVSFPVSMSPFPPPPHLPRLPRLLSALRATFPVLQPAYHGPSVSPSARLAQLGLHGPTPKESGLATAVLANSLAPNGSFAQYMAGSPSSRVEQNLQKYLDNLVGGLGAGRQVANLQTHFPEAA
jgi:hypothetical protein